ncbi:FeoB-associated Cys-rich membrane protein [Flavonifractor sp. An100]|nr:FeoB-associated Cys-rich membrane protein [Flavonifractor sp. An100]
MMDLLVGGILVVIVGAAAGYVYKAKKSGKTCIGCPDSGCCSGKEGGCCGCGHSSGHCR